MGIHQNLMIGAAAPANNDPLWSDVWLLLPLDDAAQGDVSNNAFVFERGIYVDFFNNDPSSDILAGAAKWGAKGWQCHYDEPASMGNIYQTNQTDWQSRSAALRTWGTKKWTIEFWLKIGDVTEPVGISQYRIDLAGTFTASTQKVRVRTREGRIGLDIRSSLTGTGTIGTPTIGARSGSGLSGSDNILWNSLTTPAITDNNFHWVTASYDGTTLRLTVDGVIVAQAPSSINFNEPWEDLAIGGALGIWPGFPNSLSSGPYPGTAALDGIDDVRITLSAVNDRYTSFPASIPTAAFPTF